MTPNQQKEELSKAYVAAVAAHCGFKLGSWSQDSDCLDVTIGAAGAVGDGHLRSPKLDVQLKCTSNQNHLQADRIAWSLSRSHYDSLRAARLTPIVLVVVVLPEDSGDWLSHSEDELVLKRCAWWVTLTQMPEIDGSQQSTTVHLPRAQVFSPDQLRQLMEQISSEQEIRNE